MRNSIKQLCRTPFKMISFFVLITASAILLMAGLGLWTRTIHQLNETEKVFTTIGTVEQLETGIRTASQWDAGLKEYMNFSYPSYDSILPVSILNFEGANYLQGPEKRPYYGALLGDYVGKINTEKPSGFYFFAEFSPVEDCVPTEPVLVNIERVISGDAHGSKQFWFCDHYTENPEPLKAGKTYIAGLWNQDNAHSDVKVSSGIEFMPWLYPYSSQTDKSGVILKSETNMPLNVRWEEITENFYETPRGKSWLSIAEMERQTKQTIPVLPTQSCSLLPAFHEKEATVTQGREISLEEFQSGAAVCMVTQEFAENNGLQLGDSLTLPLYFANHNVSAGYTFGYNISGTNFSFTNAQGDQYPVFWETNYKIVGIYRYKALASSFNSSEMGIDMVIIPTKSVKASDEHNIVDYGPMLSSTTSFQIPNGSISQFEAKFQALPQSKLLKITYDDNGYEQVFSSLQQTKNIAALLCAVGFLSSIAIILLLLYFFIVKQKKRTAIERSMGMSRHQCRVSLIGGIMALTIAATLIGSFVGVLLINKMDDFASQGESSYSTEFSSWATEEVSKDLTDAIKAKSDNTAIPLALGVFSFLVLFTYILSLVLVHKNLEIEPILLLSHRGD